MKKILILLLLIALSFGSYFVYKNFIKPIILKDYTASSELRDSALGDLTERTTTDTYTSAMHITVNWVSKIKTNPATSSVKMEIITTQTESAKGKKTIASSSMKGITSPGTNSGSLTCTVKQGEITSDRPHAWIKISSVIDGNTQPPIIKLLGKFN